MSRNAHPWRAGALLALACVTAQAQSLSPELSFGTPVAGPAYGGAYGAVAGAGPIALVTWSDYRGPGGQAYAARVDADGALLDLLGLPLTYREASTDPPVAGFDGTQFLVAWGDATGTLLATRVTTSGAVLDFNGFQVAAGMPYAYFAAVVPRDGGWVVTWSDMNQRLATRISPAGALLDQPPLELPGNLPVGGASDGTDCLLLGDDNLPTGQLGPLYPVRLLADGTLIADAGITLTSTQLAGTSAAVAFNGTDYLAVWVDGRNSTTMPDLYAARVSRSGALLDPTGVLLGSATGLFTPIGVAFNGGAGIVAWVPPGPSGSQVLHGAWIAPDATPTGQTFGAPLTTAGVSAGLAPVGADFLVALNRDSNVGPETFVVLADGGAPQPLIPVSHAWPNQSLVAADTDGDAFAVVWTELPPVQARWGALVFADGGTSVPRRLPDAGDYTYGGSLAYASGVHLLATAAPIATTQAVVLQRLLPNLSPADPAPMVLPGGFGTAPMAVAGSSSFWVTWLGSTDGGVAQVLGVRVTTGGVLVDAAPVQLSFEPTTPAQQASVFGAGTFLTSWTSPGSRVARVTEDAGLRDPGGVPVPLANQIEAAFAAPDFWLMSVEDDAGGTLFHRWALAASGGPLRDEGSAPAGSAVACVDLACLPQACLTTWLAARTDGGAAGLFGAAWAAIDSPFTLQAVQISDAGVCPHAFAAADHFVVTWNTDLQDTRGGAIEAVVISVDGGVLGSTSVATETTQQSDPAVAANGAGATLFAYTRYDLTGGSNRLHTRLLGLDASTGPGGGSATGGGSGTGGQGGGQATGGGAASRPGLYAVSCACGATDGAVTLAVLLLALLRRERRGP